MNVGIGALPRRRVSDVFIEALLQCLNCPRE